MPQGLAPAIANSILDALCRSVAWTDPVGFFVKLHIGDPLVDGTGSPAGETTRQAATFSAASAGAITTSAATTWTNVSTSETISHISFWDAATAGTFLGSDALAASRALTAGDNFELATGDLDLDITPLAAN